MADILDFPHDDRPGDVYPPTDVKPPELINKEAWSVLQHAANMIEGERHAQHGKAEKCHEEIAKLWTWWGGWAQNAHDVAIQMALLKIARIKTGGYNRDCYVDAAAYLALAAQLRKDEATPR